MKKLRNLAIAAFLLALIVFLAGRWYSPIKEKDEGVFPSRPEGTGSKVAGTVSEISGITGSPLLIQRAMKLEWRDIKFYRAGIKKAIASNDIKIWAPTLGDLMNTRIRRADAIEILSEALEDPRWEVKRLAAWELLQLNSPLGAEMLQKLLKSSADGDRTISKDLLIYAGEGLHSAGYSIDEGVLKSAYQVSGDYEILRIAAEQDQQWVADLVQQTRRTQGATIMNETLAGYLRMGDPDSLASYQTLTKRSPGGAVLASWNLYRATGDESKLDPVLAALMAGAGMNSDSAPVSESASSMADQLVALTRSDKVKTTLEKIADYTANQPSGHGMNFYGAIDILYNVEKDYDFVDQRIIGFMNGSYPVSIQGRAVRKGSNLYI